ncbi:hypothetical protein MKW94_001129 [Papaver nudicaule]|uniref:F-box associated beta-propeller type 3 domain-containing protein n=1 Tax=Papaver nudicaule TaxID=74823 RepID=A0AA41S611_PAPNU|nr:hypothetical protein [Papaver nudicaule]
MPCDFSGSRNRGILHNGVLHWIATRSKSSFIGGFDIADETFHEVTLPNNHSDEDDDLSLGILEGKLSLLCRNRMEDPYEDIDVWTMVDNKWSKHLKITAHMTDMYYGRPIQTLHNEPAKKKFKDQFCYVEQELAAACG